MKSVVMYFKGCPPQEQEACEVRRTKMYILYGVLFLGCVFIALCHFIFKLVKRRRSKNEIKEYYKHRESVASFVFLSMNLAQGQRDSDPEALKLRREEGEIRITTDGMHELAIEMPEDYDAAGTGSSNGQSSNSRPLQAPEAALNLNTMNIVKVDVHAQKGRKGDFGVFLSGPARVAVATVSAQVQEMQDMQAQAQAQEVPVPVQDPPGSRPHSASSYFDISDIVNSPEPGKRKTPNTC